jgi:hypothetical protein
VHLLTQTPGIDTRLARAPPQVAVVFDHQNLQAPTYGEVVLNDTLPRLERDDNPLMRPVCSFSPPFQFYIDRVIIENLPLREIDLIETLQEE